MMNRNPRNTPTPLTIRRIPGTQAAHVRAPLKLMRRIAKDPFTFPTQTSDPRLRDSEAILTATYSKMYYKGSGWWYLVGYAYDGSDVVNLLEALKKAT